MLIVKDDMVVNEIANHLHTPPTRRAISEQLPGKIEHPITVTEAARKQEDDGFLRKRLDSNLLGIRRGWIGLARCR